MAGMRLGAAETRFADLIWENEPISSGELTKLCEQELSWKKSTTYTILRRLCERGIFSNQKGMVTWLIFKGEFNAVQSEKFVADIFEGSLSRFLAAFATRKGLSDAEINEPQTFIDEMR